MTVLREAWQLLRPYWHSSERWRGRGLLIAIVALNLGEVYINVLLNQWNNGFYNALQALDKPAYLSALVRFSYLAAAYIAVVVYKTYLMQALRIVWRRWMTGHYLKQWLADQHYYRMQIAGHPADNPDQRISEDIEQFLQLTLSLSLGLLSAVVTLFSFLFILWNLSGPLDVTVAGHVLHIPGYMVWVALVYAMIGTYFTTRIGRPLTRLNFDQQRFEADFRFSLVRLRENTESVAFYKGEAHEAETFRQRFGLVVDNFWQIMKRQKRLNWFTSGYGQIAIIFPYVVTAPRFFAGTIKLGGLMQTASAFGRVQDSLSYIVDAYPSIAVWRATTQRLTGFQNSVVQAERLGIPQPARGGQLRAEGLGLHLPDGTALLANLSLAVAPGQSLLISGPSGSGKSTLLRALAGIWPYYDGALTLPDNAQLFFVPQRPYMPLGNLRQAIAYPSAPADDATLVAILRDCGLPQLADKLDEVAPWGQRLSLGEQQRIAFARALLAKPDYLFLDETTSALDEAAEAELYALLFERLPNAAIVSVSHRSALKALHQQQLDCTGLRPLS